MTNYDAMNLRSHLDAKPTCQVGYNHGYAGTLTPVAPGSHHGIAYSLSWLNIQLDLCRHNSLSTKGSNPATQVLHAQSTPFHQFRVFLCWGVTEGLHKLHMLPEPNVDGDSMRQTQDIKPTIPNQWESHEDMGEFEGC